MDGTSEVKALVAMMRRLVRVALVERGSLDCQRYAVIRAELRHQQRDRLQALETMSLDEFRAVLQALEADE